MTEDLKELKNGEMHECCVCNIQYNPASNTVTELLTPYMFIYSQCQHMICHECVNGQMGALMGTVNLPKLDSFSKSDFKEWKKIYSITDVLKRIPQNGTDTDFSRFDEEGNEIFKQSLKCPQCRTCSIVTRVPLLFSTKRDLLYTCPNSIECKFVGKSLKSMQDHLLEKCEFSKFLCPLEKCRELVYSNAIYSSINWINAFSHSIRRHVDKQQCGGLLVCSYCGKDTPIIEFDQHMKSEMTLFKIFNSNRKALFEILHTPDQSDGRESRESAADFHTLCTFTEQVLNKTKKLFES